MQDFWEAKQRENRGKLSGQVKICGVCKEQLPINKFPLLRDKRKKKPYLYYRCYDCHRIKNRTYEKQNYPKRKVKQKAYRILNKEKYQFYGAEYRSKHRIRAREYSRTYYKATKKTYNPSNWEQRLNPAFSKKKWLEASEVSQAVILSRHGVI